MRILLISDINWNNPIIKINGKIVEQENKLEYIKNKISEIKPSLVLMAGDVISDGLNIHDSFCRFFEFIGVPE